MGGQLLRINARGYDNWKFAKGTLKIIGRWVEGSSGDAISSERGGERRFRSPEGFYVKKEEGEKSGLRKADARECLIR